jgi:hypothetical protein
MALFKVVLCAWGEIVGEVVFVCAIQFEARKDRSCGIAVESGSSSHKVDHHFMMWSGEIHFKQQSRGDICWLVAAGGSTPGVATHASQLQNNCRG